MKLIINFLFAFTICAVSSAQTFNVHFKNGSKIEFDLNTIDYLDFTNSNSPSISEMPYVDLGLSVMWASCNLGGKKYTDFGDYYAWGETSPNGVYSEKQYSYYNSETCKYTFLGESISGSAFDAARSNLGPGWRMPTKNEFQELLDECVWTWENIDGVNGFLVKSNNGNSIFLPAAGAAYESIVKPYYYKKNEAAAYWTASSTSYNSATGKYKVYTLDSLGTLGIWFEYQWWGMSIRPVYDEQK